MMASVFVHSKIVLCPLDFVDKITIVSFGLAIVAINVHRTYYTYSFPPVTTGVYILILSRFDVCCTVPPVSTDVYIYII